MNGLVEELFFLEGGADDNHLKTVSQHRDSIIKKKKNPLELITLHISTFFYVIMGCWLGLLQISIEKRDILCQRATQAE